MQYAALIVDLINSKKLSTEYREQIQQFLKLCLETLNSIFKPALQFEVIFSAGDEVQGLFSSPLAAYLYLRLLNMFLAPVQVRCGMGVGEWEVRIPHGTSTEQDGQVYHNARSAIENNAGYSVLIKSDHGNDIYLNTLMNTSFLLMEKQSYSQNQIQILSELMFPLAENDLMNMESFSSTYELFQEKITRGIFTMGKKSMRSVKKLKENPSEFEAFNLAALPQNQEVVAPMWKKGFSTKIANLVGTTRQNIDSIIKAGQIVEIRNIDATAALLLAETFGR